ncbi:Multiple myeloma tumor-associated protein 2 [Mycena venus]|uniref:Multiple myeloma tumor-associated protein 2 n=1 Tax=Mycena venus TaxID=2733690 RepID=A0A8H7CAN1_9AGAR|nr:Multiple myeloma tumor-associated protein 2 [Mycena venus]
MMFEPIRGGTRGGQAEFKWSDVSADKDRENYLGHSINAPTGRWQKNKDVHWYNRDVKQTDAEREEEIRKIKEAEADALAVALGFEPAPKTVGAPAAASSSGSPKAKEDPNVAVLEKAAEKAEKRRKKAERKEKRARKEQRRLERGCLLSVMSVTVGIAMVLKAGLNAGSNAETAGAAPLLPAGTALLYLAAKETDSDNPLFTAICPSIVHHVIQVFFWMSFEPTLA